MGETGVGRGLAGPAHAVETPHLPANVGETSPSGGLPSAETVPSAATVTPDTVVGQLTVAKVGDLLLLDNWGDSGYMGLAGVQLLDDQLTAIPRDAVAVDASPRDMNDIPGYTGDLRVLEK